MSSLANMTNTNAAAKKAASSTSKGSTVVTPEGVVIAEQKHVEAAPKAPAAKKTVAAKKAASAPAKKAAPAKVKAELPYDFDLYRDLKARGTDALHAVLYDARLKTPKGSKSPEEAAAQGTGAHQGLRRVGAPR